MTSINDSWRKIKKEEDDVYIRNKQEELHFLRDSLVRQKDIIEKANKREAELRQTTTSLREENRKMADTLYSERGKLASVEAETNKEIEKGKKRERELTDQLRQKEGQNMILQGEVDHMMSKIKQEDDWRSRIALMENQRDEAHQLLEQERQKYLAVSRKMEEIEMSAANLEDLENHERLKYLRMANTSRNLIKTLADAPEYLQHMLQSYIGTAIDQAEEKMSKQLEENRMKVAHLNTLCIKIRSALLNKMNDEKKAVKTVAQLKREIQCKREEVEKAQNIICDLNTTITKVEKQSFNQKKEATNLQQKCDFHSSHADRLGAERDVILGKVQQLTQMLEEARIGKEKADDMEIRLRDELREVQQTLVVAAEEQSEEYRKMLKALTDAKKKVARQKKEIERFQHSIETLNVAIEARKATEERQERALSHVKRAHETTAMTNTYLTCQLGLEREKMNLLREEVEELQEELARRPVAADAIAASVVDRKRKKKIRIVDRITKNVSILSNAAATNNNSDHGDSDLYESPSFSVIASSSPVAMCNCDIVICALCRASMAKCILQEHKLMCGGSDAYMDCPLKCYGCVERFERKKWVVHAKLCLFYEVSCKMAVTSVMMQSNHNVNFYNNSKKSSMIACNVNVSYSGFDIHCKHVHADDSFLNRRNDVSCPLQCKAFANNNKRKKEKKEKEEDNDEPYNNGINDHIVKCEKFICYCVWCDMTAPLSLFTNAMSQEHCASYRSSKSSKKKKKKQKWKLFISPFHLQQTKKQLRSSKVALVSPPLRVIIVAERSSSSSESSFSFGGDGGDGVASKASVVRHNDGHGSSSGGGGNDGRGILLSINSPGVDTSILNFVNDDDDDDDDDRNGDKKDLLSDRVASSSSLSLTLSSSCSSSQRGKNDYSGGGGDDDDDDDDDDNDDEFDLMIKEKMANISLEDIMMPAEGKKRRGSGGGGGGNVHSKKARKKKKRRVIGDDGEYDDEEDMEEIEIVTIEKPFTSVKHDDDNSNNSDNNNNINKRIPIKLKGEAAMMLMTKAEKEKGKELLVLDVTSEVILCALHDIRSKMMLSELRHCILRDEMMKSNSRKHGFCGDDDDTFDFHFLNVKGEMIKKGDEPAWMVKEVKEKGSQFIRISMKNKSAVIEIEPQRARLLRKLIHHHLSIVSKVETKLTRFPATPPTQSFKIDVDLDHCVRILTDLIAESNAILRDALRRQRREIALVGVEHFPSSGSGTGGGDSGSAFMLQSRAGREMGLVVRGRDVSGRSSSSLSKGRREAAKLKETTMREKEKKDEEKKKEKAKRKVMMRQKALRMQKKFLQQEVLALKEKEKRRREKEGAPSVSSISSSSFSAAKWSGGSDHVEVASSGRSRRRDHRRYQQPEGEQQQQQRQRRYMSPPSLSATGILPSGGHGGGGSAAAGSSDSMSISWSSSKVYQ